MLFINLKINIILNLHWSYLDTFSLKIFHLMIFIVFKKKEKKRKEIIYWFLLLSVKHVHLFYKIQQGRKTVTMFNIIICCSYFTLFAQCTTREVKMFIFYNYILWEIINSLGVVMATACLFWCSYEKNPGNNLHFIVSRTCQWKDWI